MSGKIAEFVQTCKGCQLRKPEKIGDRAPITPIVRPELPFEIVNIDVIGPIQPPSGRGHKYVLCTNFKSALTQEFTKRIGSSPRFSCPGYPASNGLVEKWNKVLKDMIHHVIREDPRSGDRQLPFLLCAYREVPNTTTGVSPFRLLYGREARGPLAILKNHPGQAKYIFRRTFPSQLLITFWK
ncbi:transposon Ty3-I Gag-Pol polyprotein [Trichonephila clavipes]|uniref:Transposon Ty3-I Gag-Pol polyprotein n=1 Tax=Trichonephila clavipes TaxID=2585209 RepID=A0A8X6SLZ4_TRICX|nr:transposon Ty3-I Gag-Pol polyprotein [Trichonephila clavipes]